MSGVAIIRHKLANDAALTAVVAASKIMAGVVPLNTVLPAISIRQISGNEVSTIKRSGNELVVERIQVSILTATYPQQKTIIELVKNALPCIRATVNGFAVDSIEQNSTGPDFYVEEPVTYEQSVDYIVRYVN
ncbi:MAG: DUF3168 domain-containing protein [Nitrosomonas sp.]|nr:DUF3168 domain-containing protein [Nitrosomonas sp.]